jgi:hypothetical protein
MMCAGSIRFRASLMAMRWISWIDQRINDRLTTLWSLPWFDVASFFAAASAMADHRHHRECEHHQRNAAMPPVPGAKRHSHFMGFGTARAMGFERSMNIGEIVNTKANGTNVCYRGESALDFRPGRII